MDFFALYGAILAANLTTVFFVYQMYQASKLGDETPAWIYFGAVACLLFAAGSVYVST